MAGKQLILAITALVVGVVAVGAFAIATTGDPNPVVSLETLEEREVMYLEALDLYLVYNDGDPLALIPDAHHLNHDVEFCVSSRLFEAREHGEKFDIRGFYFGGPATHGLDRYVTRVTGDGVYVDLERFVRGPDREDSPYIQPEGELCVPT